MDINLIRQHLSQVHGNLSVNNAKGGYGTDNIHENLKLAPKSGPGSKAARKLYSQHEEVNRTDSFLENYFGDSLSEDTTED